MSDLAAVPDCGCPALHGAKVECACGIECAICWPWAHEPVDDAGDGTVYLSTEDFLASLSDDPSDPENAALVPADPLTPQ